MLKKTAIIAVLFFTLLVSSPTRAALDASSNIPELNPFCWHPKDCQAAREKFGTAGNKSGFVSDASTAPCNGGSGDSQWGRCLPAGTTKTEISFGGKSEFSNIGEFLVVMYKYLLTIASIVAVVVIIIAGAQWTASGGNSEAISSAKKRIGGAVIGLFIAYMSYFVLNTINPAMVNLRLPQVWMVKTIDMMPEFCSDIKDSTKIKFAFVADSKEPNKSVPPADKRGEYTLYNVQGCGNRYLAENGGETTCLGNACEGEATCFNKTGDKKTYECGDVRISGNISRSSAGGTCGLGLGGVIATGVDAVKSGVFDKWGCPPIANEWLVGICTEYGTGIKIGSGHGESNNHYWIENPVSLIDKVVENCRFYHGDIKGFVVDFEMSKEWTAAKIGGTLYNLVTFPVDPSEWLNPSSIVSSVKNPTHLVGKDGVDLGNASALVGHANKIRQEFLFSAEEVKAGARLNINASNIEDSSSLTGKNKSYWEPAYLQ